ncbi:FecR family protein [Proteiniphilum sp.]|uniref:FecR family protein n=1 Tax=Proteiniphilum sp. TaxID=1926877 RepID=UPI002B219576|nr:FecR domain-containing protein [Proteiniphilum sp.]MEA4918224.1 FecR domain-containing protein [Proteiniphilum sp.]
MSNKSEKEIIIRRFFTNLYTKEEAERFFSDVKDPGNDILIDTIILELEAESQLRGNSDTVNYQLYKQEARQLLEHIEKKRKIRFRRITAYIAAMVSVFLLSVYIFRYIKTTETSSLIYSETTYGEKRRLVFSDNSRAMLNSCTDISYPENFGKNNRRIRLSGEAYFEVKKDKVPFIVETARFDVQVLGTAFNVKAYDEDETVSVTVNDGRVQVSFSGASFVLGQKEKVTLNTRTGEIIKEIREDEYSFVWMKGGLYFDRTPIRDIARELERIYGCHIVFKEGQVFNNLISGEHDNQSLESVLQSIKYTSGIKYMRTGNQIIFYK